jgi:hypothetical protein
MHDRSHAFALYILPDNDVFYQVRPGLRLLSVRTDPSFTMSNSPGFRLARNLFFLIASRLVEPDGIEPTTSCLQSTRSTN